VIDLFFEKFNTISFADENKQFRQAGLILVPPAKGTVARIALIR
jgi:hypothetical protein